MKRLIPFLILCSLLQACRNEQRQHAMNSFAFDAGGKTDTTSYPLFIDGGTKIVYQFGYLTPDKGLKLYVDTIPHPKGGLKVDESLRRRLSVK